MDGVFKHYVIDLSCNNNFVQVPAVQGDGNNVRGFEVELISNNVQYVVDAEKVVVSIAGTKPDTKQILNECEVTEEGFILVDITSQMTAVAGRGDYSITLMDRETNALLQSFPFYILITKSAFNASDVVSSNEFQLLTHTVVDAKNTIQKAEETIQDMRELEAEVTANEDARKLAESSRVLAENERELAEQKRQEDTSTAIKNAEKAIEDAIIATELTNEATDKANQTIADAEVAIENTNTAIGLANQATQNTIDAITNANTATQNANEVTERVENLERSFTDAESIRVQNENERIQNELDRQESSSSALEQLNTVTNNTVEATNRANAISETLEIKLASGELNGKDGKDGVDGKDGIVMKLDTNEYYFSIVDGDLILTYNDGTE